MKLLVVNQEVNVSQFSTVITDQLGIGHYVFEPYEKGYTVIIQKNGWNGGRDRSTARAALGEEFPTRTLSVCAAGS